MTTATQEKPIVAPAEQPAQREGTVLTQPWGGGHKGSIRNFAIALKALGYNVVEQFRGVGPWRDKAVKFIKEEQPSLYITWQRFYKNTWADTVRTALKDYQVPRLVFDFGLWPHYGAAIIDPNGENAASAIVNKFDHYEAMERYRLATDAAVPKIDAIREEILQLAAEAEKKKVAYGLDQIPKDFIFLIMQRSGDHE